MPNNCQSFVNTQSKLPTEQRLPVQAVLLLICGSLALSLLHRKFSICLFLLVLQTRGLVRNEQFFSRVSRRVRRRRRRAAAAAGGAAAAAAGGGGGRLLRVWVWQKQGQDVCGGVCCGQELRGLGALSGGPRSARSLCRLLQSPRPRARRRRLSRLRPRLAQGRPPKQKKTPAKKNVLFFFFLNSFASWKREADDNVISAAGTVTVGKHKGRTFDDVMKNEPSYCEWIMKSELTGNLNELQKYIASATGVASNIAAPSPAKKAASQGNNVTSVVPSGKHQGKSFADMVKKERSYCEWIMGLTDIKAQWYKKKKFIVGFGSFICFV